MSNINPNPKPLVGGGATAAQGGFPYPHRSLDQVWRNREREEARGALARHNLSVCRICKGRSPEWKVGRCPACENTGKLP